jgi:hypothetical protein
MNSSALAMRWVKLLSRSLRNSTCRCNVSTRSFIGDTTDRLLGKHSLLKVGLPQGNLPVFSKEFYVIIGN